MRHSPANPRNTQTALQGARRDAGILPWPKDAMRHSFASYGYHRGLEWAVDVMGHVSGFRVFVKHYKGAASKEASDRYFAITRSCARLATQKGCHCAPIQQGQTARLSSRDSQGREVGTQ